MTEMTTNKGAEMDTTVARLATELRRTAGTLTVTYNGDHGLWRAETVWMRTETDVDARLWTVAVTLADALANHTRDLVGLGRKTPAEIAALKARV